MTNNTVQKTGSELWVPNGIRNKKTFRKDRIYSTR